MLFCALFNPDRYHTPWAFLLAKGRSERQTLLVTSFGRSERLDDLDGQRSSGLFQPKSPRGDTRTWVPLSCRCFKTGFRAAVLRQASSRGCHILPTPSLVLRLVSGGLREHPAALSAGPKYPCIKRAFYHLHNPRIPPHMNVRYVQLTAVL